MLLTSFSKILNTGSLLGALFFSAISFAEENWEWDFDHKMHFRVTQLANKSYMLEIDTNKLINASLNMQGQNKNKKNKPNKKQLARNFERGAALLIRKARHICQSYHYKLEILGGVSGVNDYKERSNLLHSDLKAQLTCS